MSSKLHKIVDTNKRCKHIKREGESCILNKNCTYPEESQCVIGHVIGCNMEKAEYRYAGKSQYYWSYEVVDDEYKVHRVNSYFNDVTKLEDDTSEQ